MNDGYVMGGALAGLGIIAVLGVLLAQRTRQIRETLAPYIGEQRARWSLYVVWFAFVYSTLHAVAQVVMLSPAFAMESGMPTAVSFGYGTIWHALMMFLNALIPLAHTIALVAAVIMLYRHFKSDVA